MESFVKTDFYELKYNETLYDIQFRSEDIFEGIYGNFYLKICAITLYLIGCFGGAALGLVVHFEFTGQAGNFRTLLNQLVTYALLTVS